MAKANGKINPELEAMTMLDISRALIIKGWTPEDLRRAGIKSDPTHEGECGSKKFPKVDPFEPQPDITFLNNGQVVMRMSQSLYHCVQENGFSFGVLQRAIFTEQREHREKRLFAERRLSSASFGDVGVEPEGPSVQSVSRVSPVFMTGKFDLLIQFFHHLRKKFWIAFRGQQDVG